MTDGLTMRGAARAARAKAVELGRDPGAAERAAKARFTRLVHESLRRQEVVLLPPRPAPRRPSPRAPRRRQRTTRGSPPTEPDPDPDLLALLEASLKVISKPVSPFTIVWDDDQLCQIDVQVLLDAGLGSLEGLEVR